MSSVSSLYINPRTYSITHLSRGRTDGSDETLEPVDVISEDDDRAVVAITVTSGGETTEDEFFLTRDDGEWKLDLLATAEASLGGEGG
jgi:hypothetical protein